MRRATGLVLAVLLLAGCATAGAPPGAPAETASKPRRCSPADPDRWAWFCVIGQLFYGAAEVFQPPSERTR